MVAVVVVSDHLNDRHRSCQAQAKHSCLEETHASLAERQIASVLHHNQSATIGHPYGATADC